MDCCSPFTDPEHECIDGYPQYFECIDVAASIASDRVNYLASRNWVTATGKNVISVQALNIVARHGKKFVEGADVVQAFIGLGMSGAQTVADGMVTKLKTVLYNRAVYQGVITITFPIPMKFSWSGGGGATKSCTHVWVTSEMSHDGRFTCYPVQVERKLCSVEE